VTDDRKTPFHNPFSVLKRDAGSEDPAPITPGPAAGTARSPASRVIPRAVVRLERTGRGGKEVTVVEHLNLSATERDQWLKALKAALGCGGSVEGDALVIQGDQRKRLPGILAARGVKKVTVAQG